MRLPKTHFSHPKNYLLVVFESIFVLSYNSPMKKRRKETRALEYFYIFIGGDLCVKILVPPNLGKVTFSNYLGFQLAPQGTKLNVLAITHILPKKSVFTHMPE